jgi:hypothetical protein
MTTLLTVRLREREKMPGGTSGDLACLSTTAKATMSAAATRSRRAVTAGELLPAPMMA